MWKRLDKWERDHVKERLSFSTLSLLLGGSFLFSILIVGIALYWAVHFPNWNDLRRLFIVEGMLFALQILIFFITRFRTEATHMMLSISAIFFGYKMIFDPFILLFLMYVGYEIYENFASLTYVLIVLGVIFHTFLLWKEFSELYRKRKKKRKEVNGVKRLIIFAISVLFAFVTFIVYAVKNDLFAYGDVLICLLAILAIFYGVLIGLVDMVVGAYMDIRYVDFRKELK